MPVAVLANELELAAAATASPAVARALAGGDPLRLELPPLPGARVAPETLRALSALYLAARLEEAGVVQVAEALVRERAVLRVPRTTAARLEDLARRRDEHLGPAQRLALFARLFGTAPAAGTPAGPAATGFEPRLAALCSAIAAAGPVPAGPAGGRRLPIELAARDLGALVASVAGNGAVLAVPRVHAQLRRALELLSDPGVGALVGARGPWETLRGLLGAAAPDLRRLVECGRHGQRVLLWLAGAPDGTAPVDHAVVTAAAGWLTACGLPPSAAGEGSR